MDRKTIEEILDKKLLNNIDAIIEYDEIGVYKGVDGCIEYLQQMIGCDRSMAEQIYKDYEEKLAPTGETPEQYEARHRAVEAEVLRSQNKPKCPTCQSTNLSKISTATKAMKIAAFGIFGIGDNGKTWKCNNCGSRF